MNIHIIGDSHSHIFQKFKNVKYIPASTIYTFCRTDFESFNIPEKCVLIISLGEVDCRFRIHEQVGDRSADDIIIDLADSFMMALTVIQHTHPDIKIIYYVPPPPNKNTGLKSVDHNGKPLVIASINKRLYYYDTLLFLLRIHMSTLNIPLLDITDRITLPDGTLNPLYADAFTIHIRDEFFSIIEYELVIALSKVGDFNIKK